MNYSVKISVVVPLYNEVESVHLLYKQIREACESTQQDFEILFVDDGSQDDTAAVLRKLHRQDHRVKVVFFRKNYGQTAAMAAGFDFSEGETVVSMDGDLQNDPADIPKLLAKLDEGYDVVCGWRRRRQDKFWSRRFPSIIANWIIGRVTGVPIHDNGCSLKAYRASIIKNVKLYSEMHRFIPAMSTLTGSRVAEMVVNHHARRFGESKYGIGRVWRVFFDITTVKMLIGFVSKPLRWFGFLSIPFVLLGGLVLLIAGDLFFDTSVKAWLVTTTVGFLLLFLSVHLIAMGVIGELSMKTGDYAPRKSLQPNVKVL